MISHRLQHGVQKEWKEQGDTNGTDAQAVSMKPHVILIDKHIEHSPVNTYLCNSTKCILASKFESTLDSGLLSAQAVTSADLRGSETATPTEHNILFLLASITSHLYRSDQLLKPLL